MSDLTQLIAEIHKMSYQRKADSTGLVLIKLRLAFDKQPCLMRLVVIMIWVSATGQLHLCRPIHI